MIRIVIIFILSIVILDLSYTLRKFRDDLPLPYSCPDAGLIAAQYNTKTREVICLYAVAGTYGKSTRKETKTY